MESNSSCLSFPRHSALGETLNLAHHNLCLIPSLLSSHRLFTLFLLFQRDRCRLCVLSAELISGKILIFIPGNGLQKTGIAISGPLFVPLTIPRPWKIACPLTPCACLALFPISSYKRDPCRLRDHLRQSVFRNKIQNGIQNSDAKTGSSKTRWLEEFSFETSKRHTLC